MQAPSMRLSEPEGGDEGDRECGAGKHGRSERQPGLAADPAQKQQREYDRTVDQPRQQGAPDHLAPAEPTEEEPQQEGEPDVAVAEVAARYQIQQLEDHPEGPGAEEGPAEVAPRACAGG